MPGSKRRNDPRAIRLVPRVKVWLERDGSYAFGLGLTEILQAVGRAGSIKEGARLIGRSYRYVWARVKKAEGTLGRPLVETHVGGKGSQRSFLTPLAREMVATFLSLRSRIATIVAKEFPRRFRSLA